MSSSPIVRFPLAGLVHDKVVEVINLLGRGLKDAHDAIIALNNKHNTLSTTVSSVSATATAAQTTANAASAKANAPVPAGQPNIQAANYSLQQTDHLGAVVLQGTSALAITLNNNVQPPFSTHLINQSSQTATLTPSNPESSVNGGGSTTVAANTSQHIYFDGFNWYTG